MLQRALKNKFREGSPKKSHWLEHADDKYEVSGIAIDSIDTMQIFRFKVVSDLFFESDKYIAIIVNILKWQYYN